MSRPVVLGVILGFDLGFMIEGANMGVASLVGW
jgi:hypothetical protein